MSTEIKRRTTVRQSLQIDVDLGPLPPQAHIEKLRVIRKRDQHEMFINAHQFGKPLKPGKDVVQPKYSTREYSVVVDYDPDLDPNLNREPSSVDSGYTVDDLATMSIADIRKTPEWSRVTKQEAQALVAKRNKQSYIDAILSKRAGYSEPSPVARESM